MSSSAEASTMESTQRQSHSTRMPAAVSYHVSPWLHFVAGGMGGMVGAIATSPLDVLRTRQQLSGTATLGSVRVPQNLVLRAIHPLYNTARYLRDLCVKEGMRGWFAGLGPALVGIVPARAIQFFTYGNGKQQLARWNGGKETAAIQLTAAALASMVTTTATSPIWMVKTRMQLRGREQYASSLACFRAILHKEGIKGLYKGTSAAYLGASESAIQWVIYEQLKRGLRQAKEGRSAGAQRGFFDWFEYFGAAALAKLMASVVSYPHEVLRTRLRQPPDEHGRVKYRGLVNSAKIIMREEGMRGFYGGLTPHLLRTVPNASIMFLAYELVLHYFGSPRPATHRRE
ncbi:Pyrimidine nucleotide transporter, mitochondrial [Coemansia interrupta]|uniref:Pyrimidine nucleotide transporter, mitochondrial n=1 Tax=Coemansia interrupta TaxID=1126814 RepID=A0A9W8LJ05_9FUNG|nr:Pyrimidine nucleotide transporter, mitochondrial [Coemansia interrupta]